MENLKYKKTFFGKKPDGWIDKGFIGKRHVLINGENYIKTELCPYCYQRLRVGKDINNTLIFHYCPICEIKIIEN